LASLFPYSTTLLALLLAAPALAATAKPDPVARAAERAFAPGPGKAIAVRSCAACHAPVIITSKRYSADKWAELVEQMIGRGARVTDADFDPLVDYLAAKYGPAAPPSSKLR
jgi:mono/diheme cytochrome c family protein